MLAITAGADLPVLSFANGFATQFAQTQQRLLRYRRPVRKSWKWTLRDSGLYAKTLQGLAVKAAEKLRRREACREWQLGFLGTIARKIPRALVAKIQPGKKASPGFPTRARH
jgi:hypothetical protein